MPIYEYQCTTCGKEFEVVQKFSDPPLTACQCGDEGSVARKLSLSAFHLKGGGWYHQGYAAGSNGNGSKTNGNGAAKPEPAGESAASAPAAAAAGDARA